MSIYLTFLMSKSQFIECGDNVMLDDSENSKNTNKGSENDEKLHIQSAFTRASARNIQ